MLQRNSGLIEEKLTGAIINSFFYVYNQLGYGFLESIYAEALARTLVKRGHTVAREVPVVVYFDGEAVGLQRVDMIVDGRVIVELKSTHDLAVESSPDHELCDRIGDSGWAPASLRTQT